ncbi:uncharacterized protein LOC108207741 [Daucus carota subsp. sativus]|uniref:uncharacterized protein LOC108207741 n=1 Tax=Daucus carota subsp. sativus TaxID=79200 RepID=UPI0007EF0C53|nr:PREDICTED: UPF0301 protein RPA0913 [Daucus carota subsp. sativus]
MDLCAIHVKSTTHTPFLLHSSYHDFSNYHSVSFHSTKLRNSSQFNADVFFDAASKRRANRLLVTALGKDNSHDSNSNSSDNDDHKTPKEDQSKGKDPPSKRNKPNELGSQQHHRTIMDWREFRASLFAHEQANIGSSDTRKQEVAGLHSKPIGSKWAHPISSPEAGCVLVATEKLDGVRTFERTVVLLLKSGTRHPQEGPFGVVINRPLHKKMKHMKPTNLDLATTFSDCPLHFGGPLEASMFLLRTGHKARHPGVEEVIPGLSFGARNSLDEAAELVKKGLIRPNDFRFFVGYAGWQLDQLKEEIDSDFWHVAACSANLIFGATANSSTEGLWEEILQRMGGHYSELSRKPKQDL